MPLLLWMLAADMAGLWVGIVQALGPLHLLIQSLDPIRKGLPAISGSHGHSERGRSRETERERERKRETIVKTSHEQRDRDRDRREDKDNERGEENEVKRQESSRRR